MARSARGVALCALCASAALVLQGCIEPSSLAAIACKAAIEHIVSGAEETYLRTVTEKCEELADTARKDLSEARALEIQETCISKASLGLDEESSKTEAERTQECIDAVGNESSGFMTRINEVAEQFANSTESEILEELSDHFGTDFKKILEDLLDTGNTTDDSRLYDASIRAPVFSMPAGRAIGALLGGVMVASTGLLAYRLKKSRGGRPDRVSLEEAQESQGTDTDA